MSKSNSDIDMRVLPGAEPRFSVFRSNTLPPDVTFAFYVPDNSLRPYFKKDALVMCDSRPLRPGDIGLFKWQGNTVCRQYNKDFFGITYLFALDRARRQEDIVIPACMEKDLLCFGRVRLENHVPLPEI